MQKYQIKLRQFQGPFELLTGLIEQEKLSINEISLAEITDQYLDYLKELKDFPAREASSFMVVAATLILIKSRSLMPLLKISDEEEIEIKKLEEQLKLYQKFQAMGKELEKIFGKKVIFQRESFLQMETVFNPPKDLSISNIKNTIAKMLNFLPVKDFLPKAVIEKTVTLEQKINDLIQRLQNRALLCFSEITPGCKKIDLIVSFLALLELIKRKVVTAKQDEAFGEIHITKHEI